jgi:hypothetical protein
VLRKLIAVVAYYLDPPSPETAVERHLREAPTAQIRIPE